MAARKLSEMEACVLALIWSDGPVTAYAIRLVFLRSPSPQWSGSAGSIYPLVARLERSRLVRSTAQPTGRRPGKLFSLSPAGRRAVQKWLDPDIPGWVAGVPPDPLRTRIGFLDALPPNQQKAFLRSAQKAVEEQLGKVLRDNHSRPAKAGFEYWTARGALLAMRARRAWLRELAQALG